MGFIMILLGAFGAYITYEDASDPIDQKHWVAFGFCALLIIIGGVIYLVRGDE